MYRHPDALRDPAISFTRIYDYYALGIVFVEIALWKPMKTALQKHQKFQGKECQERDAQKIRGILLNEDSEAQDNHPRNIAFGMGDIFLNVITVCLKGDFATSESQSDILNSFNTRVINQLERCII